VVLLVPGYAVPGLASFVSVPLLFATLGSAEYGRWALLYGVAAGVPQFTTSWLEQRLLRFGHRWGRSADRRRIALAIATSVVVSVGLAAIVVPHSTVADIVAAATLTALVSSYVLVIASLQSALAFGSISVAAMVRSVLGSVLGVLAGVATGSAPIAIFGMAAGYAVGEIFGLLRRDPARGRSTARMGGSAMTAPADDTLPPAERTSYGVASAVAAVGAYELSVGDRFLLAALRPLGDVGGYAATYSLVDLAGRFVPSVVLGAMRPRLFRAWDAGIRGDIAGTAVSMAALLAWVVTVLVALLAVAGTVLPFLPVDPILVWPIGIGFAGFMAANTIALTYSAATRQARLAGNVAVAAIANVALNLALIPHLGAFGAALATAASYGILLALNLSSVGMAWFDRLQLAMVAPSAAAFAALAIGGASGSPGWSVLAVVLTAVGGLPASVTLRRLSRSALPRT
jgi:O-antigen/teichoic acid export membrane protein